MLKFRAGKPGGGKGPLAQDELSFTLCTTPDQTLFERVCFGFNSIRKESGAGRYGYLTDVSKTLDCHVSPTANQGGLVVVEGALGIDWSSCQASRSTTFGVSVAQELSPTLIAQGANVAFMHERVRRLTPLECARLQGFPDSWTEDVCTGVSDSELQFWRPLWDRWCEVRGVKMKTDKQLKTWLATPPSDTALYKLWGNGIALPCAAFVLGALRPYLERDAHKSC